ncbi:MAG: GIY-YIG nuclease family protein [Rhodoglobus sp.]
MPLGDRAPSGDRAKDDSYYVGSTWDIERRLSQHGRGEGANYTRTRRPVELVYLEEYSRIDDAFTREKQVQNWGHAKRRALIDGDFEELRRLSKG